MAVAIFFSLLMVSCSSWSLKTHNMYVERNKRRKMECVVILISCESRVRIKKKEKEKEFIYTHSQHL